MIQKRISLFVFSINFLIFSINVYSQECKSKETNLRFLSFADAAYPVVSSNFFIFSNTLKIITHDSVSNLSLFENGVACEIQDAKQFSGYNVHLHILPDYSQINQRTFKDFTALFDEILDTSFIVHYYSFDSVSINEGSSIYIDTNFQDFQNQSVNANVIAELLSSIMTGGDLDVNIFVIITNDFENRYCTILSEIIKQVSYNDLCWSGILYTAKNETDIDELSGPEEVENLQQNLLFARKISGRKSNELLQKELNDIYNSFYKVIFSSNPGNDLVYHFNYKLLLNSKEKIDSIEFIVDYPESVINESFEERVIENIDQLIENKKYVQANEYLVDQLKKLQSIRLKEKAKELIILYADEMKRDTSIADTSNLFAFAEFHYGFSPESYSWYRAIKIQLLFQMLKGIQIDNSTIIARYNIISSLYFLNKNAPEIKLLYLEINGDYEHLHSNNWEALTYFAEYLKIENNERVRNKLLLVLSLAFNNDHKNKEYSNVYNQGKDYYSSFNTSFNLRYIYGVSCEKNDDYPCAIKEYNWLIINWKENQNLVSWNDLFAKLKNLYSLTFQFEEAIALNQRLYRQNENDEELYDLIKNLRAKYLKPINEILKVYIGNVGSNTHVNRIEDYVALIYPDYVKGIYLMDYNRNVNLTLYSKATVKPPRNNPPKYPAILNDISSKTAWIISTTTASRLLVIEYSLISGQNEQLLLSNIKSKKHQSDPWNKLYDYEKVTGYKFISQLMAAVIQGEQNCNKPAKLNSYWYAVKPNGFIKYLVHHDNKGAIDQKMNFVKDNAMYDENMWEKSSVSKALFSQEIKYKNTDIIDITNPIYTNNMWNGAIRMGFD